MFGLRTPLQNCPLPAATSPDVVAHAAEPPEVAVLASAPFMVVVPSNVLLACRVAIKETVTTVEPPEVAATAAEPSEVSVVSTHSLFVCPVAARRAVPELLYCPAMAMEAVCKFSSCPVVATEATYELLPCGEPAEEAISDLSSCAESAMVADFELSIRLVSSNVSGFEPFVLPVCIKESKLELSICLNAVVESEFAQLLFASVSPDLSIVSDVEPCICPISIYESVFFPTSPVTTPDTLSDLPVGSSSLVTAQGPAIELLTLPVTNSETINALYVCPVSTNDPDYKTVCPLSCHQGKYWWHPMFPALVLETIDALSVSCVSVFPRLQSLLWAPALSAPPWRSSVLLCGLLLRRGDPRAGLLCYGGSLLHPFCRLHHGPLFCRFCLSPKILHLYMNLAHCPSPVPPLLHHPPWLCNVWSVWKPLLGGCGSVMNQVHGLPFARHQSSLLHHIDFHTTQTVTYYPGLHFPAAISLITCSHLRTITQSHSLHEPWTSFHRSPSVVLSIALPQC